MVNGPMSFEQPDLFDPTNLDLRMYTHLTDVEFQPVYEEEIEAQIDVYKDTDL